MEIETEKRISDPNTAQNRRARRVWVRVHSFQTLKPTPLLDSSTLKNSCWFKESTGEFCNKTLQERQRETEFQVGKTMYFEFLPNIVLSKQR